MEARALQAQQREAAIQDLHSTLTDGLLQDASAAAAGGAGGATAHLSATLGGSAGEHLLIATRHDNIVWLCPRQTLCAFLTWFHYSLVRLRIGYTVPYLHD